MTAPVKVALFSGESGLGALQNTSQRVARSKGWSLDQIDNYTVCPDLPRLGEPSDLRHLRRVIEQRELKAVGLDPAYLCMDIGDDASNLFKVGKFLGPLAEIGQKTGCTIVVIHHNKKQVADPSAPAELADVAWSGFAEWVRQWILISRREKYDPDGDGEHSLWLNVGGSAGHSGLWGLDITEGRHDDDNGRRWDVDVVRASTARSDAMSAKDEQASERRRRQQEQHRTEDMAAILRVLGAYPGGETRTVLKEDTGLSSRRFGPAFSQLLSDGSVHEHGKIKKANGQLYPSYRANGDTRTHPDVRVDPDDSTHTRTRTT